MKTALACFSSVVCLSMFAGCGSHTQYEWRGYDTKLYDHYKNPSEQQKFTEEMKEVVMRAEEEGRVPPGIYAEYGFLLLEQGDRRTAVQYFQKEAAKWPESRMLMEKMIAVAEKRFTKPGAPDQPPPAGSVKPASAPSAATTKPTGTGNQEVAR